MAPITSALRRLMTAEGARVTADRDEFCGICDALDAIHARKLKALDASTARVDELCAENERLRGLVRVFYYCTTSGRCYYCPINGGGTVKLMADTICDTLHDRMCEMGIEVDGA